MMIWNKIKYSIIFVDDLRLKVLGKRLREICVLNVSRETFNQDYNLSWEYYGFVENSFYKKSLKEKNCILLSCV